MKDSKKFGAFKKAQAIARHLHSENIEPLRKGLEQQLEVLREVNHQTSEAPSGPVRKLESGVDGFEPAQAKK